MLHLLAQLLCSCDSFFHEFWPSVNVACQWNAHSLPPCLYIVMGWPCAVRNSEELWHCAVMCCLLQCSLSMSKHLLFFKMKFTLKCLSTATWNYAHICVNAQKNGKAFWVGQTLVSKMWNFFSPWGQFQFSVQFGSIWRSLCSPPPPFSLLLSQSR